MLPSPPQIVGKTLQIRYEEVLLPQVSFTPEGGFDTASSFPCPPPARQPLYLPYAKDKVTPPPLLQVTLQSLR